MLRITPSPTNQTQKDTTMNTTPKTTNHQHCNVKKRNGKHCKQPAGWGTNHVGYGACKLHGGALPSSVRSAARKKLTAEIDGQLHTETIQPIHDPAKQIQLVVGEQVAFLNLARAKLETITDQWEYQNPISGTEEIRAAIHVYERALERAEKGLANLIRLGIETKIARSQQLTAAANIAWATTLIQNARNHPDTDPNQLLLEALNDQ